MNGASEISEDQDGKLLHILDIQRIPERTRHISITVPGEFFSLAATGIDLDVAGRTLLAVVEDFQCS